MINHSICLIHLTKPGFAEWFHAKVYLVYFHVAKIIPSKKFITFDILVIKFPSSSTE